MSLPALKMPISMESDSPPPNSEPPSCLTGLVTPEPVIVGEQSGLRDVMQLVNCVAKTDVPVLILGESGSGKEVIARALHTRSQRAHGPMVKVNCGAIPPELVDSELFGHERGSFTGAVGLRKGWFERADGGTLFLDEVGELPLAAQVRLLRVLQDGTFERVGGQRSVSVTVRVVAATNRDLSTMTTDGRFRHDLLYRLSIFPLQLPCLRDRMEDLPLLASHFAARAGVRLTGVPLVPTSEDIARLAGYSWPGNVRELSAVIERAAILGGGRSLQLEAAMGPSTSERPITLPPPPVEVRSGIAAVPDVRSLDIVLVEHIERALAATRGRIEGARGAAALLGVNPHTLRARMRKLGIDWVRFRARERSEER